MQEPLLSAEGKGGSLLLSPLTRGILIPANRDSGRYVPGYNGKGMSARDESHLFWLDHAAV